MNYRTIPNSELTVSTISLGSTGIGSAIGAEESFALLDCYAQAGGNFIDTAAVYANWLPGERNVSEKTIGRWMTERGVRDQMVVTTKGAHPELETMHKPRMSRREIESDLDDSLRNLQTDVIDLYLLHRDDTSRTVEEILTVMNDQVKAGKIRYFGCSNWSVSRIEKAQSWAAEHGIDGFVANQVNWSLAVIDPERMATGPRLPWMTSYLTTTKRRVWRSWPIRRRQAGSFRSWQAATRPLAVRTRLSRTDGDLKESNSLRMSPGCRSHRLCWPICNRNPS